MTSLAPGSCTRSLKLCVLAMLSACGSDVTTVVPADSQVVYAAGGNHGEDTTPPTVPENLEAIAADDHIELSWSKSTDDTPGRLTYEVFRDESYLARSSNNQYADYDVAMGMSYSYQVLAVDKAGLKSDLSPAVSVNFGAGPPAPTCTLTASPESIDIGGSSTLTLVVSGSYATATLNSNEVTLVDGVYEEVVSPTELTTYVAVVEGEGGSSSCTATVILAGSPPLPPLSGSCLAAAITIEQAVSSEDDYYFNTVGHAVDAGGVTWSGDGSETTWVDTHGSMQACFTGGTRGAVIDGGMPFDAVYECSSRHCPNGNCPIPCYAYHSSAGVAPHVTNLQVFEDLQIRRAGDGFSLDELSSDVTARGIYMYEIHDDAFEGDFGKASFLIEDVLVDGASSGFAMRLRSSAEGVDQTDQVWEIRNSLVRLMAFPNNYAQREGHGNLYKLQGDLNEPIFKIAGNTFVLGPVLGSEDILPPVSRTHECADNTILWTGTQAQWDDYMEQGYHPDGGDLGQRLAALNATFGPTCMDVRIKPDGLSIDDFLTQEGWYSLVAEWKATHPAGQIR